MSLPIDRVAYTAATALLIYEYALVMARERRAFWHPPFKSSQFLYFIIRYAPLISRIPVLIKGIARFDAASNAGFVIVLFNGSQSHKLCHDSCLASTWVYEFLYISTLLSIVVVASLRVYVVWSLNVRLGLVVLIPGLLMPFAHIAYTALASDILVSDPTDTLDCFFLVAPSRVSETKKVVTALYGSCFTEFASDTLVISLLWVRALRLYRIMNASSVARVLLRDGTVYFLTMVGLGIPLLVSSNREQPLSLLSGFGAAALDLSMTLRSILVCRFMLNLREHGQGPNPETTDISTFQVARSTGGSVSVPPPRASVPPESYNLTTLRTYPVA